MQDKDNIIIKTVSEAVEKIPTEEKDYRKCFFIWFTLYSHSIQRAEQHIANMEIVVYLLGNSCAINVAKRITEDILHKTYTEKMQ